MCEKTNMIMRRLWAHKELRGEAAKAADSDWLKQSPMSCSIVLSNRPGGKKEKMGETGGMAVVFPRNCNA